jgi:uncharacterized protein
MFDRCKKLVTWLILSMLLAGCGSVATVTAAPVTATSFPLTITPSPTLSPGNEVTFQTEDGVQIAGTMYGTGKIAVILAHQGTPGADQTTWQPFAMRLAQNGFTALTFDFRGVGQSGGTLDYSLLEKDVQAAVRYLHAQKYNQIVCAGASMGGTACLRVAIDGEPFIGLIVLASTMSAGDNLQILEILPEEMSKLKQPKLFITAKNDFLIVVQDTGRMYRLSAEPKQLLVLEGSKHGTSLFQTSVGEELSAAMLDFLEALP